MYFTCIGMNKNNAVLISFEGCDRLGKATQSNMLLSYLRFKGYKAICLEFPLTHKKAPGTRLTYKLIYKMLKTGAANKYSTLFQAIQFANKYAFELTLLPQLRKHFDFIIFDRWVASMYAYGMATNVSTKLINAMIKACTEPDVTILLEGNSFPKKSLDSYERDMALQERVKDFYNVYKCKVNNVILSVNANRHKDIIHQDIVTKLEKIIRII